MDSEKGGRVLAVWVANRSSQHLPILLLSAQAFICSRRLPSAFLQLMSMTSSFLLLLFMPSSKLVTV